MLAAVGPVVRTPGSPSRRAWARGVEPGLAEGARKRGENGQRRKGRRKDATFYLFLIRLVFLVRKSRGRGGGGEAKRRVTTGNQRTQTRGRSSVVADEGGVGRQRGETKGPEVKACHRGEVPAPCSSRFTAGRRLRSGRTLTYQHR